ncbi:hypothetical protein P7C73_g1918, partial [Tremellales sp. Uapishka_1]
SPTRGGQVRGHGGGRHDTIVAATKASVVMTKYFTRYLKTDIVLFTVLLHPSRRLGYLSGVLGLDPQAVKGATDRLRAFFQKNYEITSTQSADRPDEHPRKRFKSAVRTWQDAQSGSNFDRITQFVEASPSFETRRKESDPLSYWFALEGTIWDSCGLRRLALDVFSTPGEFLVSAQSAPIGGLTLCSAATSVDVERLFSRAGMVASSRRSNLSSDTTAAQLLVGQWIRTRKATLADFSTMTSLEARANQEADTPLAGPSQFEARSAETTGMEYEEDDLY